MKITDQKKALRKQMQARRAALPTAGKAAYDQWICQALWQKIEKQGYRSVHCYLPMGTEINIFPLIKKMLEKGLTVVAPKTLPKSRLQHLVLHSLEELENGVFGTVYPAGGQEFGGNYDMIIVPGLAFDRLNYRLGYGGGYYDTFLRNYPSATKIGIGYPFQEIENLPVEAHDIQLDEVLIKRDVVM